ncbi:hypothetical protein Syun_008297 [Stephania yunnanensis]|uniref:Enoyl reductase (ER) domain-containing protein n=1 Tax=Stephania yunnanensis TaxID=152371 RepID=A0AAP0KE17_9MAGN
MKAVVVTSPGGAEVLQIQEVETPKIAEGEVLIKVAAAAVNGVDLLQRQGKKSLPAGGNRVSDLSAGIVEAVGEEVSRWKIGDKVCALLDGGGYAEKVAVSASQVLPIPEGVSVVDAASFLEVASAVWSTVFRMTNINAGQTFLVHGRASAAGAIAIQLAKFRGARGRGKARCLEGSLVADVCIDYKTEDFVARVKEETGGKGVDIYYWTLLKKVTYKEIWRAAYTMGEACVFQLTTVVVYKSFPLSEASMEEQDNFSFPEIEMFIGGIPFADELSPWRSRAELL